MDGHSLLFSLFKYNIERAHQLQYIDVSQQFNRANEEIVNDF